MTEVIDARGLRGIVFAEEHAIRAGLCDADSTSTVALQRPTHPHIDELDCFFIRSYRKIVGRAERDAPESSRSTIGGLNAKEVAAVCASAKHKVLMIR